MRMTPRQGAIVSAYTGILSCNFDDFHRYVEEVMGHPVWTHEFADPDFVKDLKEKSKEDFLSITAN